MSWKLFIEYLLLAIISTVSVATIISTLWYLWCRKTQAELDREQKIIDDMIARERRELDEVVNADHD